MASRLVLRWGEDLEDAVAEVGPPEGGSFLVTPGPRVRLAHASLAPSASVGGRIAARVLSGSGEPRPLVVLEDRIVELTSAPLALSARDDGGFWALHPGQIVHHDAEGGAIRSVGAQAVALVPAPEDAVWAVSLDDACLLDADGGEQQRVPWRGGPASVPSAGGALARLADDALELVGLDGAITRRPVAVEPHERLLTATSEALVTAVGGGLRHAGDEIPLQAAGLTREGRPWLSGRSGPAEVELRVGDDVRRLDIADAPAVGALRVVAVDDAVTVLGPADVWRQDERRPIDPDAVFAVAWELTSTTGTPSGSVLLAVSGPPGAALIELTWS